MESQETKKFVLGGKRRVRSYEVSSSYYFPPSSLDKLLEKLWAKDFFLGKPYITYKPITDHNANLVEKLTDSQILRLFGVELTPDNKYISHLNLKSNKPPCQFQINLENHFKRAGELELKSGYYHDKFHYNSWVEVHGEIRGDEMINLGLIEQIIYQTIVKSKCEHRTEPA